MSGEDVYLIIRSSDGKVMAARSTYELAEEWFDSQPLSKVNDYTVEAHTVDDELA